MVKLSHIIHMMSVVGIRFNQSFSRSIFFNLNSLDEQIWVLKWTELNFKVFNWVKWFNMIIHVVIHSVESFVAHDSYSLIIQKLHSWNESLNILHVFLFLMLDAEKLHIDFLMNFWSTLKDG